MKGIETGKDKVKKICDLLRKETLEPALREADEILDEARLKAEKIIEEARAKGEQLIIEATTQIAHEKSVFQASLATATRQTLQFLKQTIVEKLFNPELSRLLSQHMKGPKVLAELTTAVVKAVEKEGLDTDLSVFIPAAVPARDVNALLASEILSRLKEKSVLVSPLGGGIEVKLHKENITLDMSDQALRELVGGYARRDFRDLFFGDK